MKSHSYHFAAKASGLVGGFLVMAAAGWHFSRVSSDPAGKDLAPAVTRSSRERPPRAAGPRKTAIAEMSMIRNSGTPAERLRATIAFANTLPVSEFGRWLAGGWFTLREGPEFTLFTQILRARWLQEDPEGFVLWSIKNDPDETSSLLVVWTDGEPQKFLDFFKRHPADKKVELRALAGFARSHPDLALQRLVEMDGEGPSDRVDYFANDLFQVLAEKSPAAFEAALEFLKNPMKGQAERFLVAEQLKTDFPGELRKLFARHDGFDVYYNAYSGPDVGRIVDHLAELPLDWRNSILNQSGYVIGPDNAEKWWTADLAGAGFSESQINSLQTEALQQMAVKNPGAALKLMADFDFPPQEGDGDGNERRWGVIAKALSGNPEKAEEIIASLASDKEKEMARKSLVRIAEENEGGDSREVETPDQWLENVSRADFQSGLQYRGMLEGWNSGKLALLGEQFASLPDEQKQRVATIISSGMDDYHSHPPGLVGDSIRYLLSQPPTTSSEGSEPENIPGFRNASEYAASLAITEPDTARAWVDSLPDGPAKLWARKNLLLSWSEYDPQAADRWLKSLPATIQTQIENLTPGK